MLLDSYVVLHAAFVASLHKIIGVEFGEPSSHARVYVTHLDLHSCVLRPERRRDI